MPRATRDDGFPSAELTARETEVLRQAALGRTNSQVASELAISVHAVKFHLSSVFRKLGVRNRTEAAVAFTSRPEVQATGEELR